MSEPKFTPGPWHIGTPPPNNEQTIGTKDGMMVAVATTGVNMIGATLANAHLIAAAPELYAELQTIANADPTKWDEGTRDQFQQWAQNRARAALAKARGEG